MRERPGIPSDLTYGLRISFFQSLKTGAIPRLKIVPGPVVQPGTPESFDGSGLKNVRFARVVQGPRMTGRPRVQIPPGPPYYSSIEF